LLPTHPNIGSVQYREDKYKKYKNRYSLIKEQ
jgi:hypothetical protein